MSRKLDNSPAVIGIDIGKNSFHIVGQANLVRSTPLSGPQQDVPPFR